MRNGMDFQLNLMFYMACLLQKEIDAEFRARQEFVSSGHCFKYYLN